MASKKPFIEKLFLLRNQMKALVKGKENEFHKSKYYDINDTLAMLNPLLRRHKLLLIQPLQGDRVTTIIRDVELNADKIHESEESFLILPTGLPPQKMGGAVTYYRRYTLIALLGMEAEDDDGNGTIPGNQATPRPMVKKIIPPQAPVIPQDKSAVVTGIPDNKKPWLDLWDPKLQMFTNNYIKMVKEKESNGLTKERVLSMYKVNKRDRKFLDQAFPGKN